MNFTLKLTPNKDLKRFFAVIIKKEANFFTNWPLLNPYSFSFIILPHQQHLYNY